MTLRAGALIDIADFGDTGQVDLSGIMNTGYGSVAFEGSRVGSVVFLSGEISPSGGSWGTANSNSVAVPSGGLPGALRPLVRWRTIQPAAAGTVASIFRVDIQTDGRIDVRCSSDAYTGNVRMELVYRGAAL